ncbi:hypothetical protein ACH4TV_08800 [Streptomyces sp. NPDC020898]|uniref:hypothetical protein n=1 Tax=Streptomyces sp. NPDC020898 TaxID=3365101 RepID=UPI00378C835A
MRATRGAASTSNTSIGIRPCRATNAAICRVRPLMTLDGRYSPPGTASRTRSHSCGVRFAGSAGQVSMTAVVRSARHFAARSVRPAASWAMRTMRSLTRMPSAGPAVQPRRRRAIQAFDGSGRPVASSPAASTSTSAAFQCPVSSAATMPDTRSAAQPTLPASTAADRNSPVFSSTPIRRRPLAHVVRAASPPASGSFRLTRAPFPSVMLSSDQRHPLRKVTHSIHALTYATDTEHTT